MANLERLQREIQAARERFIRQLAVQGLPESKRLQQAYTTTLKEINAILAKLEAALEANRSGARLDVTLQPYIAQLERELQAMTPVIEASARTLEASGATAGVQVGVANLQVSGVRASVSRATIARVQSAIEYVDSAPFQSALSNYAGYHAQKAGEIIISAMANGRNPRETAGLVRRYFGTSQAPLADALRLTRTTQLYAGRWGTIKTYEANGVEQWIWISARDLRTCAACWSLHGSLHPVTEVLNDHHNGRCAPGPVTARWQSLGLRGQDVTILDGETLFNRLPADQQQQILGREYYAAYQAGKFQFNQLNATYSNPIFGVMRRKTPLAELLQGPA